VCHVYSKCLMCSGSSRVSMGCVCVGTKEYVLGSFVRVRVCCGIVPVGNGKELLPPTWYWYSY
jgi:hypothetical protein